MLNIVCCFLKPIGFFVSDVGCSRVTWEWSFHSHSNTRNLFFNIHSCLKVTHDGWDKPLLWIGKICPYFLQQTDCEHRRWTEKITLSLKETVHPHEQIEMCLVCSRPVEVVRSSSLHIQLLSCYSSHSLRSSNNT